MFQSNSGSKLKPRGVKTAIEQNAGQHPPLKLLRMEPLRSFLVEYSDERGRSRTTVATEVAGVFYEPPNAEEIARGHKPFGKKLFDQMTTEFKVMYGHQDPPNEDDAEVMES